MCSSDLAQISALADDIAYLSHDIDDGLRAGLFSVHELTNAPLAGPFFRDALTRAPGSDLGRLIGEGARRLITAMVEDVTAETSRRVAAASPSSVSAVRAEPDVLAAFSAGFAQEMSALKGYLFRHMYRHERVMNVMTRAQKAVGDLFGAFLADPSAMPEDWAAACDGPGQARTARAVADYIAGMTDRFALQEYKRIFHMDFLL